MTSRIENEIEHGKKISSDAESVWNWSSKAGKQRANRRAELFVSVGKINKYDKVLEIGCGTGLFTQKVYDLTGATITAIDISEDLLSQARIKLPQANFLTGDAMNMDFEDSSFNVIFGSSVLHHLNMESALVEAYRVLDNNGRIIFAEPNMLNPQILIQKNVPYIKEKLGDSPDETAIVRWQLMKMMKRIGYKNVKTFPYDFLHPVTPGSLISTVSTVGKILEKIPIIREIAGSVIIYGEK